MKWVIVVAVGLAALVALMGVAGAMLPRSHRASRTLRTRRPPADVWTAVAAATAASTFPADTIESRPPNRLVTKVKETEKMFGGTWTFDIAPAPDGSTLTITEDGWVANPIVRFMAKYVFGHHATMDAMLKQVATTLNETPVLTGE
jgi:hypothetical protein